MSSDQFSEPDLEQLRDLAEQAARKGGQKALDMRAAGIAETESKSSISDIVTRADREVEILIKSQISKQRPDDTILGEEGGTVTGSSGLRWVIDPIDGTVNYYYQYPGWVVSIAVESEAGILAGVIYDPMNDDLYDATKGGGARLNGQPIVAPNRTMPQTLAETLVATGFGYRAERRKHQAEALVDILPKIRDIRRGGAAAADLCHLAIGRVDAYFELGLNPWDYAAGLLIARECGCTVEILNEADDGTDAFLVGARSEEIYRQLSKLVK